jgi:hypothetical protein
VLPGRAVRINTKGHLNLAAKTKWRKETQKATRDKDAFPSKMHSWTSN